MDRLTYTLPEFFYDLLGIFIPGFYLCFGIILIHQTEMSINIFDTKINETAVFVFLCYFSGHLVYSFSSLTIAKIFNKLFGSPPKDILLKNPSHKSKSMGFLFVGRIENQAHLVTGVEEGIRFLTNEPNFKLHDKNYSYAFEICRNYLMEKTLRRAFFIRKEQSYGEMARGIIFSSLICLALLIILSFSFTIPGFILKLTFFFLSFIAFSYRYLQARYVSPMIIYTTFCSLIVEIKRSKFFYPKEG